MSVRRKRKSPVKRERKSHSIKQVCEDTGLGKTKVYELIGSGALKSRLVGRRRIILDDELSEFLGSLPTA
jgi:excisionase family DNA binding protein